MSFSRPTLQSLTDRILADFKAKMGNTSNFLRRSTFRVLAQVQAGAVHLLYGYQEYKADQMFISTADADSLEFLGGEYGIARTQAVEATGSVRVTGIVATAIPLGTKFKSADDEEFVTDAAATIAASGSVDVAVTAVVAGAAGNEETGTELEFVSPIGGVNGTVEVISPGISGGADTETDDAYRERLLARKQYPPHGGARSDYVAWALEVSGVTRAWCIPEYDGAGTVGVGFVRDGDTDPVPNDTLRQEMYEYLLEHTDPVSGETVGCPVGAQPGLEILDIQDLNLNPDISVHPFTDAVKDAVEAEIEDLITRDGGPGETIYLSKLSEAISAATGEARHRVNSPTADVVASALQFHRLGTITWRSY